MSFPSRVSLPRTGPASYVYVRASQFGCAYYYERKNTDERKASLPKLLKMQTYNFVDLYLDEYEWSRISAWHLHEFEIQRAVDASALRKTGVELFPSVTLGISDANDLSFAQNSPVQIIHGYQTKRIPKILRDQGFTPNGAAPSRLTAQGARARAHARAHAHAHPSIFYVLSRDGNLCPRNSCPFCSFS